MTVDIDIAGRLLQTLRTATGLPDLDYSRTPAPLRGGFWAELLSFSLARPPEGWPSELVARIMPEPGPAQKEAIVQRAVAAAGFPTPAVRASGGPADGLGRAFIIMDLAPGSPALAGLDLKLRQAGVRRLLREIPDLLATAMTRLHALDPKLVHDELSGVRGAPVTEAGLLAMLVSFANDYDRPDLADAGRWLAAHPPPPAPEVICHGDLHPFNLLTDGDRATVLDWSTVLLAPRAHDVAFTALLLASPPLTGPAWQRPFVLMIGRVLARRFISGYRRQSAAVIGAGEITWYQAVACLRALTEAAGWEHDGTAGDRAGHPWLTCGPAFATQLAAVTGRQVRAR